MFFSDGQLGLNQEMIKKEPTLIDFFHGKSIIDIQCGSKHTVVLCQWGLTFSFGSNKYGQVNSFFFIHNIGLNLFVFS